MRGTANAGASFPLLVRGSDLFDDLRLLRIVHSCCAVRLLLLGNSLKGFELLHATIWTHTG